MLGISKEQLAAFPEVRFPGKVVLVDSAAKARDALIYLNKLTQIGFDTETRPSFRKDQHYKVSLVQLSTDDECFLFRLKLIGSLKGLADLFENPSIQKIGLSIKDDFHSLERLPDFKEFKPAGFIELQTFVKQFRIADNSLQKIYGVVFNRKISKSQRLTNWEAPNLSPSQQSYAAIDAWACLKLYNHLAAGGFNPDECPYRIDDETALALQRSVGIRIETHDNGLVSVEEAPKTEQPVKPRRRKSTKTDDGKARAKKDSADKPKAPRKPRKAKTAASTVEGPTAPEVSETGKTKERATRRRKPTSTKRKTNEKPGGGQHDRQTEP